MRDDGLIRDKGRNHKRVDRQPGGAGHERGNQDGSQGGVPLEIEIYMEKKIHLPKIENV